MKAKYITPVSLVHGFVANKMLANSPTVNSDDDNEIIENLNIDTEGKRPKVSNMDDVW